MVTEKVLCVCTCKAKRKLFFSAFRTWIEVMCLGISQCLVDQRHINHLQAWSMNYSCEVTQPSHPLLQQPWNHVLLKIKQIPGLVQQHAGRLSYNPLLHLPPPSQQKKGTQSPPTERKKYKEQEEIEEKQKESWDIGKKERTWKRLETWRNEKRHT